MELTETKQSNIISAFKDKFKNKKTFRFIIIWFFITVLLEILVFNYNSFNLVFGDYNKTELSISEATLLKFTLDENGVARSIGSGEGIIEFTDINVPVGTIYLDIVCSDDISQTTIAIDVSDSSNNVQYRYGLASITVINGYERSQTIPCQFSGDVSKLRFHTNLTDKQSIVIKGITVNKPIVLHFSIVRFLFLFFAVLFFYLLIKSDLLQKTYAEKNLFCYRLIIAVTSVFLILAILSAVGYRTRIEGTISEDFRTSSGDQITQGLVDAFEKGQVELLAEPSESLLKLNNPYDLSERNAANATYLWDHCYYNGHYYSYYGIAPVVFVFLPYHLITGYYFPYTWAVLLFGMIGIIFLSKLYLIIIEKWFYKLRINFVIMGLIFLQISSGIWFCISRAAIYEIAISSGFATVLIGAYFLISSNVIGDGKVSKVKVALATTFLSISVLCRPTLAVYCIASLAFLYYGFKKIKLDDTYNKKQAIIYILCALLPFVIFGGIQMAYNWLRFDSIFEFGVVYSLSINDFTNSRFHLHYAFVCIYSYLFATPYFQPKFPFVYSTFQMINLNGYFFADDKLYSGISIGLFYRAFPMFAYFLSRRAYRSIEKTERKKPLILIGLTSVIAPLIIIISIWQCGYAVRYIADFSWQILIGAFFILFTVLVKCKSESVIRITTIALTVSTFICIIINFAQLYSFFNPRYVSSGVAAAFYSFERLFEFWR